MSTPQQDEKKIRELEKFAKDLAARSELYGAAQEGLSAGIDAEIAKLESYDLDAKMVPAEDDIAAAVVKVLNDDVASMEQEQQGMDEAEQEETKLLEEDEGDPEVEGRKLAELDQQAM